MGSRLSPFTIYRLLLFFRYALCSMLLASIEYPLWLLSLVTSRHSTGFEGRIIVDLSELHIIEAAVLTMAL